MAYCTVEDVEDLLGRPLDEDEATALEIYLEIIETVINEWLLAAGRKPEEVEEKKKKLVAQLMGEQATYAFGVDPTLTNLSTTSGDSNMAYTRISGAATRFLRKDPLYLTILGIKRQSIGTANLRPSWR